MKDFPYVSSFIDNRGKLRHRFRRKGVAKYLPGEPGSRAFILAYTAALEGKEAQREEDEKRAPAGTIGALASLYFGSADYLKLRASTKRTYRSVLDPWLKENWSKRVSMLERRHITAELGKMSETPGQANKWLKRVHKLLEFGVREEFITSNPARGIRGYKLGDGAKPWDEDAITKYQERWPVGTTPRLAFDLLIYTGQRRSDVVRMSKSHVRNGEIRVVQKKTDKPLWIPIHPKLQHSIDETTSKCTTFLCTEYNRPFSAGGFGNWFRDKCDKASLQGYSAHGLRKTAGYRLAEAGCTSHQIMAILGVSLGVAEVYTKGADQRRLAREGMEKIG